MSSRGRWCAAGAILLGIVTVATWNLGHETDASPHVAAAGVTDPSVTDAATIPSDTARPEPQVALDGADLFVAKGCAACHVGPDSQPFAGSFPPLDDASSWAGSRKPGMTAEEYLTESMLSPRAFRSPAWISSGGPTDGMPELFLNEVEVDALVAYLLAG